MILLFFAGFAVSILLLLIGLIKPSLVLRWGARRTRKRSTLIYGLATFAFLIGMVAVTPDSGDRPLSETASSETAEHAEPSNPASGQGAKADNYEPPETSVQAVKSASGSAQQPKNTVRFELPGYYPPAFYEGEVNAAGEPHGKGKITWAFTEHDAKTGSEVEKIYTMYEGEFQNGVYHGKGTLYNKEHEIEFSGIFDNGEPVLYPFENEFYYNRGTIEFHGDPAKQKVGSRMKVFHLGGNLFYEGEWKNGEINGKGTMYYWDGKKKEEGTFKNRLLDGNGKRYYENGVLSEEGEFREGRLNGKGKLYHENGQLKTEGTFKDGQLVGKAKVFDENGVLRVDGKFEFDDRSEESRLEGDAKVYNEKGALQFEGEFKDGELNGDGVEYYENGKVKYRGGFRNGKYDGKGTLYNDSGQVLQKGEWRSGKFVGE
jgi:antitoxin component YwqK of YwqJK toxin-antitoxin module